MFLVEKLQLCKMASTARKQCEEVMQAIYNENPRNWPYGLDIDAHDGGVYMVREATTKKPIGFAGWQERQDGKDLIGFYSIGILPEYRNNGYAKQAVAALINMKAAGVDKVRALIMHNNTPSLALADALHVPVIKVASGDPSKGKLKMLLSGLTAAGFMDVYTNGQNKNLSEYIKEPITAERGAQLLANTVFGAAAGHPSRTLLERVGILSAIPAKDFSIAGIRAMPSLTSSFRNMADAAQTSAATTAATPTFSNKQKALGLGIGTAGLLGGGYLAYKAIAALKNIANAQEKANRGKIRVALPTKEPGDQETIMELPVDDLEVSKAQFTRLQRDMRRRIRKETKERTVTRTLGNLLTPGDVVEKAGSAKRVNFLLNIIHG